MKTKIFINNNCNKFNHKYKLIYHMNNEVKTFFYDDDEKLKTDIVILSYYAIAHELPDPIIEDNIGNKYSITKFIEKIYK